MVGLVDLARCGLGAWVLLLLGLGGSELVRCEAQPSTANSSSLGG